MFAFVQPFAHARPAEVVHARDQRDALVEDAEADAAGDLSVDLALGASLLRFIKMVVKFNFLCFIAFFYFFIDDCALFRIANVGERKSKIRLVQNQSDFISRVQDCRFSFPYPLLVDVNSVCTCVNADNRSTKTRCILVVYYLTVIFANARIVNRKATA